MIRKKKILEKRGIRMKAILLNGSPRKNFSTAQLLQQAQLGAEAAGAETELIHLVDYEFTDCRECYVCKLKNSKTGGVCAVRDSIQPVLKKIWDADVVIVGSPVYFSYPNGQVISLLNRSLFPIYSYFYKDGKPDMVPHAKKFSGLIYAMNCKEEEMEKFHYPELLGTWGKTMDLVYGYNEVQYCCNTYQYNDYSRYRQNLFDEADKKRQREEVFPQDLKKAYDLGMRLTQMAAEDRKK